MTAIVCSVPCKKYLQHTPEQSEADQAVGKVLVVMESDVLGREEEGQGKWWWASTHCWMCESLLLQEGMSRVFPRPDQTRLDQT